MPRFLRLLPLNGLLLAACSASAPSARVTALLGGAGAVAVIADRSTAVHREAFRIDSVKAGAPPAAGKVVHGYPVLSGPVALDGASSATLAEVLLDDATYRWDSAKACEFAPGIALRQTRGGTTVDVLICFSCDELAIWVDGVRRGHEDMDPRRADLVRIARRLFPGDAKVQALR